MEKVKLRLYQLTVFFTLVSLALSLITSGKQREFFYFAIYASIIGLFFERKNITFRPFSIALPILLAGMFNFAWYMLYEYPHEGMNIYNGYLLASKKLILGSILIFYLDRFKSYISAEAFQRYFLLASGIGFFLASAYALWQMTHGFERAEMGINRATISAYIYSVLSLAFIYGLYLQKKMAAYVAVGVLILFSWVIIFLTGTRAAMGLYLIISTLMTLYHFRKVQLKTVFIFLGSVAVLSALSYNTYIKPRIDMTVNEINSFKQGEDDTSLGARFSMWTVGIENGLAHPLGQSIENREKWTGNYVTDHPHFAASMIYINVHLHNEFIEKYSLQGIAGGVLLAFVFISLLVEGFRKHNTLLLMTTLSLLLYGLTDVILLSPEAGTFFLVMFALCTIYRSPRLGVR